MKGEDFRRWAERGCRIYGDDPLFFLRELAQNARDAGARSVEVRTGVEDDATAVLSFEDDGSGMTVEHARRFLFRLYASSKERDSRSAGYYGIGFWSVLRFKPAAVYIESRAGRAAPWGVRLEASLDLERVASSLGHSGTRVTLVRPLADGETGDSFVGAVGEGVARYCRYLRRNDRGASVLPVRYNGALVSAPIEPDGPVGLAFRRGPVEGAVGLGEAASVELLARGLPVWRGTLLDELSYGGTGLAWKSEVARGLSPVFTLNGNDLAVVMARNAVIDDAALGRVRDEARDALARLVEMHVGAVAGGGMLWRVAGFLRRLPARLLRSRNLLLGPALLLVVGSALLLGAMGLHNAGVVDVWSRATGVGGQGSGGGGQGAGVGGQGSGVGGQGSGGGGQGILHSPDHAGGGAPPDLPGTGTEGTPNPARSVSDGLHGDGTADAPALRALATVPSVYRGATVDAPSQRALLPLAYSPPVPLWFKFLTADRFDLRSGFVGDEELAELPYPLLRCTTGCVQVTMDLGGPGAVVLPCPTGYAVDAGSVRGNGLALGDDVRADRHGQAVAVLPDGPVRVTYSVGPALESGLTAEALARLVSLPQDLDLPTDALEPLRRASDLGVRAQVDALARVAGRLMKYDDSAEAAQAYLAPSQGAGWLQFVLSYGRGDCDVINAVAAVLLRSVGIPARLAVGAVGLDGRVLPGSHAWVEYHDLGWHAVDVSRGEVVRGDPVPSSRVLGVPQGSGVEQLTAAFGHVSSDRSGSVDKGPVRLVGRGRAPPGAGEPLPGDGERAGQPEAGGGGLAGPAAAGGGGLAGPAAEGIFQRLGTALPLAVAALLLMAFGFVLLRLRGRERFRFRAAREEGARILADMLRSAQAQPSAWRHAPSLWRARVLPLLGRGTLSLARASSLARRGGLYLGTTGGRLAALVSAGGLAVLDSAAPHYGAVSLGIPGIVDLDRLEGLSPAAPEFEDRLLARVIAILEASGVRLPLLWCRGMTGRGAAAFNVGPAGRLPQFPLPQRFVGLSPDAEFVRAARRIAAGNEALAVLHVVEGLVEHVDSLTPSPRRLLARVARRLLEEGVS